MFEMILKDVCSLNSIFERDSSSLRVLNKRVLNILKLLSSVLLQTPLGKKIGVVVRLSNIDDSIFSV